MAELQKTNTPHVVVDISEENIRKLKELHPGTLQEMLYIVGDATEEDILEKAGLGRAAGLIAGLPLDKDNLVVTVIARQRFPKNIPAPVERPENIGSRTKAGAFNVFE